MKFIFVRHGETQEGKKGILLGSQNGHLTQKGKQEAKKIASELKGKRRPDIIVSSPLQRALETAQIISKILGIDFIIDPLTQERAGGMAEGKKESEIDWELYERKPLLQRNHAGGESFLEVYKRAKKFIKEVKNRKEKTILVVSHSVFILMCMAVIKNKNIEDILRSQTNKQKTRKI